MSHYSEFFFSLPQVQNLNVAPAAAAAAAAASICYNVCTYYVGYNVDVMRSKIDMRVWNVSFLVLFAPFFNGKSFWRG